MRFHYVLTSLRSFWIQFFDESSIVLPVELGCDNSGSIKYSENKTGVASRLKHIDIRDAMIKDFCTRRLIKPIWHSTKLN
ncbi:unnamed protein product, partial [Amoebophrya sp. A25]|eukprot:GSA25T00027823001.1